MEAFWAALILVVGTLGATLGAIAVFAVVRGWVLSILWGWFMVPFFELPELSIPFAIGIALVVGLMTHQTSHTIKKEYHKDDGLWMAVLSPFITLFFGWIVTWFI